MEAKDEIYVPSGKGVLFAGIISLGITMAVIALT